MGDVQDDSSPAAMRVSSPIPGELCKPTRAVSLQLPLFGNCQLPAQSKQGKAPERQRERGNAQAGWQGRAGQGRQGPEVATGWHSRTGKLEQQGGGVVQGWHVSPLRPRDLDAGPPGGSPQCRLLNERATVGDLMDPEMVVVIKNKYALPR